MYPSQLFSGGGVFIFSIWLMLTSYYATIMATAIISVADADNGTNINTDTSTNIGIAAPSSYPHTFFGSTEEVAVRLPNYHRSFCQQLLLHS